MPQDLHSDNADRLRRELLAILDESMRLDGAASGKIRIADPATGTLAIAVHRGFTDTFVSQFASISLTDNHPAASAVQGASRVIVNDLLRQSLDSPYFVAMRKEQLRSMQVTPIVGSEGRVLGTLATHFKGPHYVSLSGGLALDHCARRAARVIEELG